MSGVAKPRRKRSYQSRGYAATFLSTNDIVLREQNGLMTRVYEASLL